jgi:hypothetical protein
LRTYGALFCNWKWIKGLKKQIDHSPQIFLRMFSGAGAITPVSWPSLTWLILPYLEHNAYLHQIVYSYWANNWWSHWDTTDAVDITKFLRALLAFGQNTRFTTAITDWPSTFGNRITFKHSIEQIQFTDSHRFFWKGSQKVNIVDRYANEQSDTLLERPLSDKTLLYVTYSQPIQLRSAHILCLATDVIRIIPYLGSVVKLSIIRGRISINWPSNSRVAASCSSHLGS